MSISSTNRKAGPYLCNGTVTAFQFGFKVFSVSDVRAVLTSPGGFESDMTLTEDYTVSLNADQDSSPGGELTTTAARPSGYKITLTSQVSLIQPAVLTNLGGFYPKVINGALDRLTILVQQVAEQVSRAVKVGISSETAPDSLVSALVESVSEAQSYSNSANESAGSAAEAAASASASASAAALSASAVSPSVAGHANMIPVVNATGTDWLMKTASQLLSFLGLGAANSASGVVVLDGSGKLPPVDGSLLTGLREQRPGEICFFARATAPTGFLKANGAAISRAAYADLFAAIGTTFGVGDGSTTFNLPDLRGEFLRGWDDGRGVDAGRVFGSAQTDAFKSHTHPLSETTGDDNSNPGGATRLRSNEQVGRVTGATGGDETRPRNVALLACIKY